MTKNEFMAELRSKLSGVPEKDAEDRLGFYSEIIDDRMEEGISEEEAVRGIGSIDEIAAGITAEISQARNKDQKRESKRKLKTWEIVLLAAGSPVWVPLAIAAVAVTFSLYAVLWALVISLWAVFVAFTATAGGSIVIFVVQVIYGNALAGVAILGAGLILAGSSIFLFFGCKNSTKGTAVLAKKIALGIKRIFVKKEAAK
ncbi:MAG: DUF1700 domain-containing protein [Ruminococcaceae bacterium]|nr:DUF1700 domain-containing protein [Oscillospiraceae bacterium]